MGLAASQARFLGLTARKSNVEYQVQQINQHRTALSNEVLGLYNEYNRLDVPTPPSINDYNKTTYKLDSTYEDYEISSFTKILDGEYKGYYDVVLSYEEDIPAAYTYTAHHATITADTDDFSYVSFQLGADTYFYEKDNVKSNITKITDNYDNYDGLRVIMNKYGLQDGTFYMFKKGDTYYYTSENSLATTEYESEKDGRKILSDADYAFDYKAIQKETKEITAKGAISQTSNGRLSSIQIVQCEEDPDLVNHTYQVTASSYEDQLAYQEAMNEYNYKKDIYEKEVQTINNKTKTLQQEDRDLELQLNQLDTEQNALSTEMDSVSKVIEDTIESVFKTFQ